MYKILFIKNRYKKSLKLSKGLDWFKKNTPLTEIVIEEISTDFSIDTTEMIVNETLKTFVWGQDIYQKMKSVVPEGKYHCVVVVDGNDEPKFLRPHGYAAIKPLYPGTDIIQLFKTSDSGKTLNHEMFHTFFHRLQRQQVMVDDPMDYVVINNVAYPYYNNDDLNAVPSNRSISLARLAPYWDLVQKIITVPVITPPMPPIMTYKWFKMTESTGNGHTFAELHPKLREMLDKMRDVAGVSFVITSGMRTPGENVVVGGKPNSAHLRGLAVDLLCVDNFKRTDMLYGISQVRETYPCFVEIARKHIHIDIDQTIHALDQTIVEDDD